MTWPGEWDDHDPEADRGRGRGPVAKADYAEVWMRLCRQQLADAVFRARQHHQTEDDDDRGR